MLMQGLEIPQLVLFGGGLFLVGFFIFIVLYLLVRVWAERREHVRRREK
jgi:hypothetical protein